jgi:hypothetical protein
MHDLAMNQGFALLAWNVENNALAETVRVGRGYVGQEVERIMRQWMPDAGCQMPDAGVGDSPSGIRYPVSGISPHPLP